jgi:uncharacterized protein
MHQPSPGKSRVTHSEPDRAGRFPIHYEAHEGRSEDLRRSLAYGADPGVADRNGFTPLHFAAQALDPEAARLLIEAGAPVDARNKWGATPLLVALFRVTDDDRGVIGMLLAAGADPDATNNYGVSPRSLAERVSNWDLKRFLTGSQT